MHVVLGIVLRLVMLQELAPHALLVVLYHWDNTILEFNAPWEFVPTYQALDSTGQAPLVHVHYLTVPTPHLLGVIGLVLV